MSEFFKSPILMELLTAVGFGKTGSQLQEASAQDFFGDRRLQLPVLTTMMHLVERTLNTKPLTSIDDSEALPPKHFLFAQLAVAELLMLYSLRNVDGGDVYIVAQAYNQMISNRRMKQYLPKLKV